MPQSYLCAAIGLDCMRQSNLYAAICLGLMHHIREIFDAINAWVYARWYPWYIAPSFWPMAIYHIGPVSVYSITAMYCIDEINFGNMHNYQNLSSHRLRGLRFNYASSERNQ
eukprot:6208881-Pleurochrysis_carterae.AAC.1